MKIWNEKLKKYTCDQSGQLTLSGLSTESLFNASLRTQFPLDGVLFVDLTGR